MSFCNKCGYQLNDKQKFCPVCGTKKDEVIIQQTPQTPTFQPQEKPAYNQYQNVNTGGYQNANPSTNQVSHTPIVKVPIHQPAQPKSSTVNPVYSSVQSTPHTVSQPYNYGVQNQYVPIPTGPKKKYKENPVYLVFSILGLIGGISVAITSLYAFILMFGKGMVPTFNVLIYSISSISTGIPSIIFSAIGRNSAFHDGKATTGFILSLISLIMSTISFFVALF